MTVDPADPRAVYAIGAYAAPWAIYPSAVNELSVWRTYAARIRTVPEPGLGMGLVAGVGLIGSRGARRGGAR